MDVYSDHSGKIERLRVGILCQYHADLVTEAVLQDRALIADIRHPTQELRRRDKAARERKRQQAADQFRGDQPGFVYYLRVGERVKIGFSVNVKNRMRALPAPV